MFRGEHINFLARLTLGQPSVCQEDVNGEKLTVKKWWIFGADFFTVWCRFFHGLRRFFTVCKGHKRRNKKIISLSMSFFTVSFSRFAPSRVCPRAIWTLTRAKSLCLCAFFLPELGLPSLQKFGCVIAQAFFSRGASEISLKSRVSSAEFSGT